MGARELQTLVNDSEILSVEKRPLTDLEQFLERALVPAVTAFAFVLPLKLSWGYAVLMPLLLLWLAVNHRRILAQVLQVPAPVLIPLLFWVLAAAIEGCFSLDPIASSAAIVSFIFYLLLLPISFEAASSGGRYLILFAAVSGQSVAALHTVLAPIFSEKINRFFVGAVTESGQLTIVIPIAIGLVLAVARHPGGRAIKLQHAIISFCSMIIFCSAGFLLRSTTYYPLGVLIIPVLALGITLSLRRYTDGMRRRALLLLILVLPLLGSALLLNLKRGPWFGIALSVVTLLSIYKRRFVIPLLTCIVLTFSLVTPVRDRVLESYDNFVIYGGRQTIWELGFELAAKYPMGIGYKNGGIMRQLDPSIPTRFNHFHSNPLNILVETGWIGLSAFLWWIASVLKFGFSSNRQNPIPIALAAGFLSWQAAGLVEYNFGDSEVYLIGLMMLGVLGSFLKDELSAKLPVKSR